MSESDTLSLDARIAHQVRARRAAHGLSLEALASRCGVSRSMLSLVERGESSPTAAVLDRIATGLGVPLAALFDAPQPPAEPVSRLADQAQWRDPASGYVRRNVSPPGTGTPFCIVEVEFPPGARVAYETGTRAPRIEQQVWVLDGTIEVTSGTETHRLHTGDCLAMTLDRPTGFHNPTRHPARYAVVIAQRAAEAGP
jgi:transcriptional regulator with XRE-family HTH domain